MPYGHPASSGHGRRTPAYRWSPSVLPPSSRRKRRRSRSRPSVSASAESPAATAPKSPAATTRSRRMHRHPAVRTAAHEPSVSVSRLLGKMAASLATGFLEMVGDMLTSRKRISDSFERIGANLVLIAAMTISPAFLALGGFVFLNRFLEWFESMVVESSIEEYDANKKRICIHRKTSVNAPPTPEAIRRAWEAARGSLMGKLLAGTLLSDLEPVVDQSYLRDEDGTIVGRRPGIKGWLRENCPDMLPHYKALMNYKALADKLRRALGVEEPDTLAAVLDFGEGKSPKSLRFHERFSLQNTNEETVWKEIHSLFGELAMEAGAEGQCEPVENDAETSVDTCKNDSTDIVVKKHDMQQKFAKTSVNSMPVGGAVGTMAGTAETGAGRTEQNAARMEQKVERTKQDAARGAQGVGEETWTMAALDAAVRERLGLAWMRRGRRRAKPAA